MATFYHSITLLSLENWLYKQAVDGCRYNFFVFLPRGSGSRRFFIMRILAAVAIPFLIGASYRYIISPPINILIEWLINHSTHICQFLQDPLQGWHPLLSGRLRRRSEGPVRPHDLQVRLRRRSLRRRQGKAATNKIKVVFGGFVVFILFVVFAWQVLDEFVVFA